MANYYVWSGASGAGTGATWANAYTALATAMTSKSTGDVFWVAHDHSESLSATTTISLPNNAQVLCVTRGPEPPTALATGATITNSAATTYQPPGGYMYGMTWKESGALIQTFTAGLFESCTFELVGTNTSTRLNVGTSRAIYDNCTVKLGAVGQTAMTGGANGLGLTWRNSTPVDGAGSLPTNFWNVGSAGSLVGGTFENCDLSNLSAKSLIAAGTNVGQFVLKNCKLPASFTFTTATVGNGYEIILINCDSADTNYRTEKYQHMGTQTTETTIVRSGGASDGTTAIAWKIVTTANAKKSFPFEALPISFWNETVGSAITITVEGTLAGSVSLPTTDEIWMAVSYSGDASTPLGSRVTLRPSLLATGSAHAAGSGTWAGGTNTQFKMVQSVTPQNKGPITVDIRAAKASTTYYIDPKVVVT